MPAQSRPKFFDQPTGSSGNGWHQIEPFTICPKEYQFKRVRKIKPYSMYLPEPLSVGLYLHVARAQWLYDGRAEDSPWREAMERYRDKFEKEQGQKLIPQALDFAARDFAGYIKYWSVRPVTETLAIEYQVDPRPLIPNAPEWAWRSARYDSIEKQNGKVWIGELKSTNSTRERVSELYVLHGQVLLQASLWGEKETREFGPLAGILIDPLIKGNAKTPGTGAPRIQVPFERLQPALRWFKKDFTTWVMQASMINWNDWVERRPVCVRAQGACDMRSLCLNGRDGAGDYVMEDGKSLVKWSPSPGKEVPPWE